MATKATKKMTRKKTSRTSPREAPAALVEYRWGGDDYTLDLRRKRVYRNFMAVETNKGFTILGAYRSEVGSGA